MADPLTMLRQFHMSGRTNEIKEETYESVNFIVFDDLAWPKQARTNYKVYGSEGEYYSLECLYYFLKNIKRSHSDYVRLARGEFPIVHRPDRRDLIGYLEGTVAKKDARSVDQSAPLAEMPTTNFKKLVASSKAASEKLAVTSGNNNIINNSNKQSLLDISGGVRTPMSASKKARLDDSLTDTTSVRTANEKSSIGGSDVLTPMSDGSTSFGEKKGPVGIKNLSQDLTTDKIAEIRAKLLSNRRTRIKPESDGTTTGGVSNGVVAAEKRLKRGDGDDLMDDGDGREGGGEISSTFGQTGVQSSLAFSHGMIESDEAFYDEVVSKERNWRNRTNILQATGKQSFSKTINAILASVRTREGKSVHLDKSSMMHQLSRMNQSKPASIPSKPSSTVNGGANNPLLGGGGKPAISAQQHLPNYNRYDQEQFSSAVDGLDAHGFNIETTGTFSGMTLKSVTESPALASRKGAGALLLNKQMTHHGTNIGQRNHHNSSSIANRSNVIPSPGGVPSLNVGSKRVSRTPIIIIPSSGLKSSLITLFNAKDILQDMRFVTSDERKGGGSGASNTGEVLIQRRKEGSAFSNKRLPHMNDPSNPSHKDGKGSSFTVPYRIIDNTAKLSGDDWDRVVAVFVLGQTWQFKGWPWNGNPTIIFSKISAFHLKWDDAILDKNVSNWAVKVIPLSREKRHLDRAKLMVFWETLDKFMMKSKSHLRF